MSWFVDTSSLNKGDSSNQWWTKVYRPGDKVEVSGIYRCLGCENEVAANKGIRSRLKTIISTCLIKAE